MSGDLVRGKRSIAINARTKKTRPARWPACKSIVRCLAPLLVGQLARSDFETPGGWGAENSGASPWTGPRGNDLKIAIHWGGLGACRRRHLGGSMIFWRDPFLGNVDAYMMC